MIRAILNFFKGSMIGIANTIPGVSGGTIAVIAGIYAETLEAISHFRSQWKKNLLFLLPIILGLLTGLFGFARLINFLFANYSETTFFFFIGLILGSIPFLLKESLKKGFSLWYLIPFAISLAIVLPMVLMERPEASEPITEVSLLSMAIVFGSGIISSAAMIIPGISGSFLLLLMGMYSTFIHAAAEMIWPLIIIFLIGSVTGIALVSRLFTFLLRRFHGFAYAAILGLVIGSLGGLFPGVTTAYLPFDILSIVAGFASAYFLSAEKKEKAKKQTP